MCISSFSWLTIFRGPEIATAASGLSNIFLSFLIRGIRAIRGEQHEPKSQQSSDETGAKGRLIATKKTVAEVEAADPSAMYAEACRLAAAGQQMSRRLLPCREPGKPRSEVFRKPGDYVAFLRTIPEASLRVPMPLLAYYLLSNHFHLVVRQIVDSDLSRWMHWLMST